MTQPGTVSVEDGSSPEADEQSRSLTNPTEWQWATIALIAVGQAIPGFYTGTAYAAGRFAGFVVVLYILVLGARFLADRIGWTDDARVFSKVSVIAAVASVPAGVILIPTLPVYVLLLLVIYIPLRLFIVIGGIGMRWYQE